MNAIMRWEVDWVGDRVWIRFGPEHRWWHWFCGPDVFFAQLTREQAKDLGSMLTKLAGGA